MQYIIINAILLHYDYLEPIHEYPPLLFGSFSGIFIPIGIIFLVTGLHHFSIIHCTQTDTGSWLIHLYHKVSTEKKLWVLPQLHYFLHLDFV